ncbi:MAG: hypothetical protein KDK63_01530 [Chlamydiia bacterium]|nr:hypothetical protein [Chlamydiia bacterium]MCB1115264.1 hypothetical protein [Chlamydiia bacterium]
MRPVWKRVAGFACANFALPGLIFGCRLLPKSLFGRLIPHLPSENQILALSYATQAIAISAFPTDSMEKTVYKTNWDKPFLQFAATALFGGTLYSQFKFWHKREVSPVAFACGISLGLLQGAIRVWNTRQIDLYKRPGLATASNPTPFQSKQEDVETLVSLLNELFETQKKNPITTEVLDQIKELTLFPQYVEYNEQTQTGKHVFPYASKNYDPRSFQNNEILSRIRLLPNLKQIDLLEKMPKTMPYLAFEYIKNHKIEVRHFTFPNPDHKIGEEFKDLKKTDYFVIPQNADWHKQEGISPANR